MTALMRQGGQKRLLNRIRKFDTVKLSMESGKEVAAILKKYTEDSVKASSAGVGTFYVWVSVFTFYVWVCLTNPLYPVFMSFIKINSFSWKKSPSQWEHCGRVDYIFSFHSEGRARHAFESHLGQEKSSLLCVFSKLD